MRDISIFMLPLRASLELGPRSLRSPGSPLSQLSCRCQLLSISDLRDGKAVSGLSGDFIHSWRRYYRPMRCIESCVPLGSLKMVRLRVVLFLPPSSSVQPFFLISSSSCRQYPAQHGEHYSMAHHRWWSFDHLDRPSSPCW